MTENMNTDNTAEKTEQKMETVTESIMEAGSEIVETPPKVPNNPEGFVTNTTASSDQVSTQSDCGCGPGVVIGIGEPMSHVYAIGSIRPAFPNKSVEKEFYQIAGRMGTTVPDNQLVYEVLTQGENLYLAREMCWIFQIEGIDTYIVKPRTYVELNEILLSILPNPGSLSYAVIVGPKGPIAGPEFCNGVQLPIMVTKQFYHFTFNQFTKAIVDKTGVEQQVAASMFQQMLQLSDNAGNSDEHRAINYITLRYLGIYTMEANMLNPTTPPTGTFTFDSLTVLPAQVQGARRIVDVIFNYEERNTGERLHWYCKVDVTGQFPFLVTKLNRYFPAP